jgi:hypothetical protein
MIKGQKLKYQALVRPLFGEFEQARNENKTATK